MGLFLLLLIRIRHSLLLAYGFGIGAIWTACSITANPSLSLFLGGAHRQRECVVYSIHYCVSTSMTSCHADSRDTLSIRSWPPLPSHFFLYTPRLCPLSSHPLPLTPASVALTTKKGVCHITVPCSVFLSVSSTRLVDRYSLALLALPRHPNSLTRIPHLVTYPFDYRAW